MSEQDYKNLNVDEVLQAVRDEQISAEEALLYEKEGKRRKSLIEALEALVNPNDSMEDDKQNGQHEQPKQRLVLVKFVANAKVGPNLYKVGNKLEVTHEDYEAFVKAGVITKEDE